MQLPRKEPQAFNDNYSSQCNLGVSVRDGAELMAHGDIEDTVSRLTGMTNVSMKAMDGSVVEPPNNKFDIEGCTVTQRKNGEIVEQKVFYDLVGMQKQIELII